jgi:hypothetical protein
MALAISPTRVAIKLVQAGVKRTASVFRSIGVGGRDYANWTERAEVCARCPLVVTQCGKSYCGRPFLKQIARDEPTEGCGCPVIPKAKDVREHCPRDEHFNARCTDPHTPCNCLWCVAHREKHAV